MHHLHHIEKDHQHHHTDQGQGHPLPVDLLLDTGHPLPDIGHPHADLRPDIGHLQDTEHPLPDTEGQGLHKDQGQTDKNRHLIMRRSYSLKKSVKTEKRKEAERKGRVEIRKEVKKGVITGQGHGIEKRGQGQKKGAANTGQGHVTRKERKGQGHVKKYPANIDLVQRKRKGNTENDQGV